MKITFLGTGTSQGVPVIGCTCDTCCSSDARDARLRSSVLLHFDDVNILIDAGPDFRQQMLANQVKKLDAILITHEHNDHVIGLDDIRPFNFTQKKDMPIYGLRRVLDDIRVKFAYIFDINPYPGAPKIVCHEVARNHTINYSEELHIRVIGVMHGNLPIVGYRIGNFAYITDASYIDEEALRQLENLEILVINALQYRKHYTHFNFEEAIAMAQRISAATTYLTHMSHELGYHKDIESLCPDNIFPAYDGLHIVLNDI